jgi:hypothetical protein
MLFTLPITARAPHQKNCFTGDTILSVADATARKITVPLVRQFFLDAVYACGAYGLNL